MSRIDVIVPCYNYSRYLRQCIESILSQPVDLRVLIIDDASTDDTEAVANELVARDHRTEYLRHSVNQGHIATYNEGLEWAASGYTLLISADDYLVPDSLLQAATFLDDHPDVSFVYGRQIAFLEGSKAPTPHVAARAACRRIVRGMDFIRDCCATGTNPVTTPTVVARTELLRTMKGYRPELPHTADMELWLRLALKGSVGWIEADQAYKRMHDRNMQRDFVDGRLGDLQQRWAAFEIFFGEHRSDILDSQRLEGIARRSLSMEAFWAGSEAFDRCDRKGCQRLMEFALSTDDGLRSRPEWARFSMKRRLGPLGWRVLSPVVDAMRGRTHTLNEPVTH